MNFDEGDPGVRFTTPLDNDFQWYNLYMRQFGSSAYPPPMPKNPSTTTAQYPTQRDVAILLATDKASSPSTKAIKKNNNPTAGKPARSRAKRDSDDDDFDSDSGRDDDDENGSQHAGASRERLSTLDTLTDLLEADDLFSPNFFDFLKGPDGAPNELFSVLLSPKSQRALNDQSIASGPFRRQSMFSDSALFPAGSSFGGAGNDRDALMPATVGAGNPHGLPREVYNLQSEAWSLLLDNRALAWLQREASEKGKNASMVRLQLLQVATGSSYAHSEKLVRNLARAAPSSHTSTGSSSSSAVLTTEQSFQRVYESFSPFFAILSPPAQVKRLRDQYHKAVRAQKAGRRGPVADLVGLPMFSQYATWREAYEHRKVWPCTPFSFFLIHDQSYNYAHVSAIYVLISVIKAHMHRHSPNCTDTSSSTVDLEMAGTLLSRARTARHQVAIQRQLCPYRVMEQMTENLIIAFENSDAKNALTMISQVSRFLTDCALDQETAARFLDRSALLRQAQFKVPGLNVADSKLGRRNDSAFSRSGRGGGGGGDGDGDEDGEEDGADGDEEKSDSDVGALEMLFALRHFGESEFHALFDLTTWFLDAATANVRVPIDASLCPPPRLLVHPGQVGGMAFTVTELSTSSPAMSSVSLGSTQSRQTLNRQRGGGGGAGSATPNATTTSSRLPTLSPRSAGGGAADGATPSPMSPLGAAGGGTGHHVPREHRYIPGRHQQHKPVGSLVDAFVRFEMRREQLLNAKAVLLATSRGGSRAGESGARSGVAHSSFSVVSAKGPSTVLDETTTVYGERSANAAASEQHNGRDSFLNASSAIPGSEHVSSHSTATTANVGDRGSATATLIGTQAGLPAGDENGRTTPAEDTNSGLNEATTVLATPLIILSTYIRLHGASWLKNLLDRLFNVLRRESVLLYVNRLDLEASTSTMGLGTGLSHRSSTGCASPVAMASVYTSATPTAAGLNVQKLLDGFDARMERLEDLISQDIQYAMNEFLSALHGRRSATRLPQGVTTLLTQFCSTVHLHLLRDVLVSASEGSEGRPGSAARRVAEHVHTLKQKRVAAKTIRNDLQANQSLDQLLLSIEQYRLAKFILFDTWIIPALNNAVALGHLPDNAPLHLRWNIDAFARYLKILVNAPFTAAKARMAQTTQSATGSAPTSARGAGTSSAPGAALGTAAKLRGKAAFAATAQSNSTVRGRSPVAQSPSGTATPSSTGGTSGARKKRQTKESMAPPDELVLPPYITGIYDVSSGTLIRLHDPAVAAAGNTPVGQAQRMELSGALESSRGVLNGSIQSSRDVSVTLPTMATSRTMIPLQAARKESVSASSQGLTGRRMKKGSFPVMDAAPWENLSSTLQSLNQVLGIVGYDPEDDITTFQAQRATAGLDENCAMRVLDFFCQRASTEVTSNVVVSEFEVLPSVATGCIEKIFDFVAGKHPLIEHAMDAKVLPDAFSFSPYLAALTGVLLHPLIASQALDNVYHNSPRFYDTLMRPVEDETMLKLVSALVVDQGGAALVDCNALAPLVASQRTEMGGRRGNSERAASAGGPSLAAKYDEEMRKLVRCKTFLTSGAHPRQPVTGLSYAEHIQRMASHAGPVNPRVILEAGRDRVMGEAGFVPTCFDLWWRSMTLAMTVKVITVLVECSAMQSDRFLQWCQQKIDVNKREYRLLTEAFVRDKGGETITDVEQLRELDATIAASPVKRKTGASRGAPGSLAAAGTRAGSKVKPKAKTTKKGKKAKNTAAGEGPTVSRKQKANTR